MLQGLISRIIRPRVQRGVYRLAISRSLEYTCGNYLTPGPEMMNPVLLADQSLRSLAKPSALGEGETPHADSLPRILVVDDEALIADTICQILNRSGFIAQAAYGGQEAIETARRITPELVLSDVLMPHVDGVEAAIAIREFSPDTRIVLFSGQAATVEILARARERGHNFELLPKPLHPTQLIKHLRST
jgi:CheY-like chemotaxis protein